MTSHPSPLPGLTARAGGAARSEAPPAPSSVWRHPDMLRTLEAGSPSGWKKI